MITADEARAEASTEEPANERKLRRALELGRYFIQGRIRDSAYTRKKQTYTYRHDLAYEMGCCSPLIEDQNATIEPILNMLTDAGFELFIERGRIEIRW